MRRGLDGIEMPNDFEAFEAERACQLYISACNLDTAERVIFGADEEKRVTISEAMQASTALPGFYRPVRLDGVDYVDGGVRSTANIDVAIEKGADLIICYNPFRPFVNDVEGNMEEEGQHLSDRGMKLVINQVFRTLLHTRLKLGLQQYLLDERFQGDIVLLEPQEHDAKFFAVNPLAFWKRGEAMRHGFESVNASIEQNFDILQSVLGRYGLRLSRAAARQKAERARADLGWNAAEVESSLRLVGS
jgi:predicted acylesterase/phospholipase RssA